jgi:hypothetical protein
MSKNPPRRPATSILTPPIRFPASVKARRLGIAMVGMISCGSSTLSVRSSSRLALWLPGALWERLDGYSDRDSEQLAPDPRVEPPREGSPNPGEFCLGELRDRECSTDSLGTILGLPSGRVFSSCWVACTGEPGSSKVDVEVVSRVWSVSYTGDVTAADLHAVLRPAKAARDSWRGHLSKDESISSSWTRKYDVGAVSEGLGAKYDDPTRVSGELAVFDRGRIVGIWSDHQPLLD